MTRFRRLAMTHAAMIGGDAAMLIALADSLFLSIDPSAARGRVLLFLIVSFAPFVVIAPLIGPAIDRATGGRRAVIQVVALARVGISLAMAMSLDSLALFPLTFAALVLQKAYLISKQAIVPSVVSSDDELVEANAKLGVLAGLAGVVGVVPAGLLQVIPPLAGWATLLYAAGLFGFGFLQARRLPDEAVVVQQESPVAEPELHAPRLRSAELSMMLLRASVGFLFFHLAFWLRSESAGTFWFGVAVAGAAVGTMIGNVLAPRVRPKLGEERMLSASLALVVGAGTIAMVVGGTASGVALAGVVNFAAATGRLAFESLVQRMAPHANQGQAFARFETRFQLGWVVAGVVPVVITIPGRLGFLIVAVIAAVALGPVLRFVSDRWAATRAGRATDQVPPPPPASAPRPPG